ncbi:MAG: DUF1178 family protein [Paracoccus sp. (in: a-proteobacteria)]|uniref:DUF1178 family protein n=1 Tax=Paracoccus sp. TaxID=267 RepID=UPI0039193341
MIRYAMRCNKGHDFDGWFRSSDAYDTALMAGAVTCSHCGSTQVEKALMAPKVASGRDRPLSGTHSPAEAALEKLRQQIEANSDYVGLSFADEARAMHDGHAPARAIHGEAPLAEARKLIEDGVPVTPLPFLPRRKTN